MNGQVMKNNEYVQELVSPQALSYMAGLKQESFNLSSEALWLIKKTEIAAGVEVDVSPDEWLSSSLVHLMDENAYGYSAECMSEVLQCSSDLLRVIISNPEKVALEKKYEVLGRLSRLICLLNR